MWIHNKQTNSYYEVTNGRVIEKIKKDTERFEVFEEMPEVARKEVEKPFYSKEVLELREREAQGEVIVDEEYIDNDDVKASLEVIKAVVERDNYCSICDKEFKGSLGLQTHNRAKHGGE